MKELTEILKVLYDAHLEFVVIGGAYAKVKSEADLRLINGMEIAVLSLIGLIKSKEAAGRPKDLYVLAELKALEQLKRKTGAE